MTALFLLAAGSAKRYGSNKLLALWRGERLWRWGYCVLREVAATQDCFFRVVTRYPEILAEAGENGVFCPESEKGLSETIRAAIASCEKISPDDRLLFAVADQPNLTVETVHRLLAVPLSSSLAGEGFLAACAYDGENEGNPVVFSGALAEKLADLRGDAGGKSVLRDYPNRLYRVLCRAEELTDVDFPTDG